MRKIHEEIECNLAQVLLLLQLPVNSSIPEIQPKAT